MRYKQKENFFAPLRTSEMDVEGNSVAEVHPKF
jgi:hypothetical protein